MFTVKDLMRFLETASPDMPVAFALPVEGHRSPSLRFVGRARVHGMHVELAESDATVGDVRVGEEVRHG